MAERMQQRRGTTAEWAQADPVLADGEIGVDTSTRIMKIGNGVNKWSELYQAFLPKANGIAQKGDLLVGGVYGDPTRFPVLGIDGQFLATDSTSGFGLRWVTPFNQTTTVQYQASTTWTKPTGVKAVEIILIGGGGGGAVNISSSTLGASGGAGGGYGHWIVPGSSLTSSVALVVGAAGQPGNYGSSNPTDGGASAFGRYSVTGGKAGVTASGGIALGGRPSSSPNYFISTAAGAASQEVNPFAGGSAFPGTAGIGAMAGGGAGGGVTSASTSNVVAKAGGQTPGQNGWGGVGGNGGNGNGTTLAATVIATSGEYPGGGGGGCVGASGGTIVGGAGGSGEVTIICHF